MWQRVRRFLALRLTALVCLAVALIPNAEAADPPVRFTDVTLPSGIEFRHVMGDDKMTNIVEASGVGCAWLDFDGDGWLDIYLVNGAYRDDLNDPTEPVNKESLRTGHRSAVSQPWAMAPSKMSPNGRAFWRATTAWGSPWPTTTTMGDAICT